MARLVTTRNKQAYLKTYSTSFVTEHTKKNCVYLSGVLLDGGSKETVRSDVS